MRIARIAICTACTILLLAGIGSAGLSAQQPPQGQQGAAPAKPGIILTSTAFEDGAIIPGKYTQAVPNPVTPELAWINVPTGTVTFALIVHDPEGAPQKQTADVLHWIMFNIPGTAHELPEGMAATAQLPDGTVQAKNTRGTAGFMGPGAGPAGPYHHYTFELYALDAKLDLGPDASRADILNAMNGHVIGKGVLIGKFHR